MTGKWCDLNSGLGDTSGNSNLLGSLQSCQYDVDTFYYDEYFQTHNKPIDEEVINYCNAHSQPLIVNHHPIPTPLNLKPETYAAIKVPIVFVWFDFVHDHIKQVGQSLLPYAALNVVMDTQYDADKFISLWVPQDHRLFYESYKDIEVSFVGSRLAHYAERVSYLDHLANHGVNVYISGGQREAHLTMAQYADILRRSKITINFNGSSPTRPLQQAKCRIYEAMLCGAMLLEQDNSCIKRWFEPNQDYIPFSDPTDLENKIRYYTTHENERMAIARNGHDKMIKSYHSSIWWDNVFNHLRLRCP